MAFDSRVEAMAAHVGECLQIEWSDGTTIIFQVDTCLHSEDNEDNSASCIGEIIGIDALAHDRKGLQAGMLIEVSMNDAPVKVLSSSKVEVWSSV